MYKFGGKIKGFGTCCMRELSCGDTIFICIHRTKWKLTTEASMFATEIHLVESMGFIGVTYIGMGMELLIGAKRIQRQLLSWNASQHEIQLIPEHWTPRTHYTTVGLSTGKRTSYPPGSIHETFSKQQDWYEFLQMLLSTMNSVWFRVFLMLFWVVYFLS